MEIQIEKKEFYRKLTSLVMPIAFQQFMLALVSASDAFMLGLVDQTSLAAVSLATQLTFVYQLFLTAFTIGTGIFAAQYWGKGDRIAVEKLLGIALRAISPASAVFFAGTAFVPELLMRIFTADAGMITIGAEYLRIISLTYLCLGVSQSYLCIMKNSGYAAGCMLISSVTVVANIVLNAILIFGLCGFPEMGAAGAALATLIARALELAWTMAESRRAGRIRLRITWALYPDHRLHRDFWKYTTPVLGNELVWGCGFTMYSVIMGHLGSDAVAANSIANVVKNLTACFCIGLGSGGSILVGNELGAGRLTEARNCGNRLTWLSVISGAVTGVVILLLIPVVTPLANLTEQASRYLKWMLVMCSYYIIGKSINSTTIGGIFCAGGDSRFGFRCDTITMWCVTVPLGCIAAFVLHLPVLAVYFIVNLDEIVKLPAVFRHYRKYLWVKNLTEPVEAESSAA